jgi:protein involved in polysaccharide export with SLBB domain
MTTAPLKSLQNFVFALALLSAAMLAACSSSTQSTSDALISASPAAAVLPAGAGAAAIPAGVPAQALASGDKIKVVVFREEQLSGEFEIDGNGRISLPLIGAIEAAGKTAAEVEAQITARLKAGYVRDPKVSVLISNFRPIYILGEVKNAGEYPYKSGLNVVSAVALAGGYSYRANTTTVYVRRASETAEREYPAAPNIPIHPGDLIRIGERYF